VFATNHNKNILVVCDLGGPDLKGQRISVQLTYANTLWFHCKWDTFAWDLIE